MAIKIRSNFCQLANIPLWKFIIKLYRQIIHQNPWEIDWNLQQQRLYLTLSGTGQGIFIPFLFARSDFVSWIFFKNFQTLSEVKIEINQVILTPCSAH